MNNKKALITCLLIAAAILLIILPQTTSAAAAGDLQIVNIEGDSQTLSAAYIQSLPQTTIVADINCYGVYVTGGSWAGVKLTDLLTTAGIDVSSVGSLKLFASDGYQVQIDPQTAMRSDVIVAYQKDGVPLTETYRLVIPGVNGNLWISQIIGIGASDSMASSSQAVNQVMPPIEQTQSNATAILTTKTPSSTPTQTPKPTPLPSSGITQPIAPPTNTPQPTIDQSIPQQNTVFSMQIVYIAVIVVVAALVLASFVVVHRRKVEA